MFPLTRATHFNPHKGGDSQKYDRSGNTPLEPTTLVGADVFFGGWEVKCGWGGVVGVGAGAWSGLLGFGGFRVWSGKCKSRLKPAVPVKY